MAGCGRACAALRPLRLAWRLTWPLSLIVRDADLAAYNDILTLLLQVGRCICTFGSASYEIKALLRSVSCWHGP